MNDDSSCSADGRRDREPGQQRGTAFSDYWLVATATAPWPTTIRGHAHMQRTQMSLKEEISTLDREESAHQWPMSEHSKLSSFALIGSNNPTTMTSVASARLLSSHGAHSTKLSSVNRPVRLHSLTASLSANGAIGQRHNVACRPFDALLCTA